MLESFIEEEWAGLEDSKVGGGGIDLVRQTLGLPASRESMRRENFRSSTGLDEDFFIFGLY